MLNTFFFGYLSLKWCRLVRTLLIFISPLAFSLGVAFDGVLDGIFWEYGFYFGGLLHGLTGLVPYLLLIALISWLIKPFVVKEN
jgi:hypothetical protein